MFNLMYISTNASLASVHQELKQGLTKQKISNKTPRQFLLKIFIAFFSPDVIFLLDCIQLYLHNLVFVGL